MDQDNTLSEREQEILRMLATGASNKEIAYQLNISPNTVKVHLRNIFSKIEVASRTEAVMFAVRTGLVAGAAPTVETVEDDLETAEPRPEGEEQTEAGEEEVEAPKPALPNSRRRTLLLLTAAGLIVVVAILFASGVLRLAGDPLKPFATASEEPLPEFATPAPAQRWQVMASLPAARSAAAGAVYENHIYVIGGETAAGLTGSVLVYDEKEDRWLEKASKNTPVSLIQAAVIGEKIYVPGGKMNDGQPSNQLEIYDPRNDRWEKGAPLPVPLSAYALAALDGRLFLFGGETRSGELSAKVFVYDPFNDNWNERSPLPQACKQATAVALQGKIYVMGGFDGKQALTQNLVYSPARDRSGEKAWDQKAPLPAARYAMGATSAADQIYLMGGLGSPELKPINYLLQSDQWLSFDPPPQSVGSELTLLTMDNRLYTIGGRSTDGLSAQTQAYQAIYTILIPLVR
jgi:DNA-binding CsgD family transcriptional regulator/N-acetylneuraminic acid mutarotase